MGNATTAAKVTSEVQLDINFSFISFSPCELQ
jgi:hypothetical protein